MTHGGGRAGVSFVVPVHNGARWLEAVLSAILAQADGRPMQVLVVDDQSHDASATILRAHAARGQLAVLPGPGRGAAAAINLGIRHSAEPIICQVDQDVILEPGWMARLTAALAAPDVAAAQGYYATPRDGRRWARVMGLDLEARYARLSRRRIDHVCTGNTAYRAEALRRVGLFDEALGYGYDNDMSYRLLAAGYRLVFCQEARSVHRWREGGVSYLVQQYGAGYGRLDVIAKHPSRVGGDAVSGPAMLLHAPGMLLALLASLSGLGLLAAGGPWRPPVGLGLGLAGVLGLERVIAGARAARRFRDPAGWWFGPVHLLRDVAWAAAIGMWAGRRLLGRRSRPADSMRVLPGPAPADAPPGAVAPSAEETGGCRGDGSRRRGPLVA